MPSLQKNQLLRLSVTGMNDMGNGVARVDGLVIFVTGAVTGDTVDARVIKVTKGYAVARTETLITPSPDRVENTCTARGCGGCAYRALSYAREKAIKEEDVRHAFRKAGLDDLEILPLLSTDVTDGYRNKAQYPVACGKDGRTVAGFYASHSHRVVEAPCCPLQAPAFSEIVRFVTEFCDREAIRAYDEESGKGLLRHIYLRTNRAGDEVLLTLVINGCEWIKETEFVSEITARFPHITGILLNENREKTNVICGKTYRILYGKDYLTDTMCGVRLRVSPPSFYQVNHDAAELLYRTAADMACLRGDETMLDLFCGIGSIGLSMAGRVRRLVGIEIVPEAIACAKENARLNDIENAAFYSGDATDFEALLEDAKNEIGDFQPNIVVLDPPRKGCEKELLLSLATRVAPEKILYISCNPDTLARDAAVLSAHGYTAGAVQPVDLFPRTGHVETVLLFTKQNENKQENM